MADETQKAGMFEENPGEISNIRVMSFTALIVAIAIAIGDLFGYNQGGNAFGYVTMFLVGAFCPKVIQKFAEK